MLHVFQSRIAADGFELFSHFSNDFFQPFRLG